MDPSAKQTIFDTTRDAFPTGAVRVGNATRIVGETANQFLLKTHLEDPSARSPILVKTPTCQLKMNRSTGKKTVCDLVFSTSESEFFDWVEKMESFSADYLFENQRKWFTSELSREDVENLFLSPFKIYKSTKTYTMRAQLAPKSNNLGTSLMIFDENQTPLPYDEQALARGDDSFVAVIELVGIRCSAKNFQIDVELKQLVRTKRDEGLTGCLIPSVTKLAGPFTDNSAENLAEASAEALAQPLAEASAQPLAEALAEASARPLAEALAEALAQPLAEALAQPLAEASARPLAESVTMELVEIDATDDVIKVKTTSEVYQSIYEKALQRAMMARDLGVLNYLESKNIKNTNLLLEST